MEALKADEKIELLGKRLGGTAVVTDAAVQGLPTEVLQVTEAIAAAATAASGNANVPAPPQGPAAPPSSRKHFDMKDIIGKSVKKFFREVNEDFTGKVIELMMP